MLLLLLLTAEVIPNGAGGCPKPGADDDTPPND